MKKFELSYLFMAQEFAATLFYFLLGFQNANSAWVTNEKNSLKFRPEITNLPETFRIPENDRVVLPCNVNNLGDYVVVWRKGHEMITAGKMMVSRDPRYRIHSENYQLELNHMKPNDAGDFVCQISFHGQEIDVAHTVEVLVPPRIRPKQSDGKVVVKKGTQVTLECLASGNPVPDVRWSREHDLLPHGKVSCANHHCYTIIKVDRYDSGRYFCSASNGVGQPANSSIILEVMYEPEIEVEAEKVHTGQGKEAHLTCIVHGDPAPSIRWYKDSVQLTPSHRIGIEKNEITRRYTLVLQIAEKEDFGNYSCVAENSLGTSKKHIEVHGRPTPAVFRPLPTEKRREGYFELFWTTDSYTHIEEYRLLYRQIKPFHPGDGLNLGSGSDWTNIIIPGDDSNDLTSFHHSKRFPIPDVIPDMEYECLVQARNRYGWSEASRIHRFYPSFSSSYVKPEARDLGWTTGNGNKNGHLSPPLFLVSYVCLLYFQT